MVLLFNGLGGESLQIGDYVLVQSAVLPLKSRLDLDSFVSMTPAPDRRGAGMDSVGSSATRKLSTLP